MYGMEKGEYSMGGFAESQHLVAWDVSQSLCKTEARVRLPKSAPENPELCENL